MSVFADIRYGLRRLRRDAPFSVIGAVCVALGIGASTAVFSVANVLLLRPVPGVEQAARLVTLRSVEPARLDQLTGTKPLSYPDYLDYRRSVGTLRHLAGYSPLTVTLAVAGGAPRRIEALLVTDNYFAALSARPSQGRLFAPRERAPERLAVVSRDFWLRSLGGAEHLAGVGLKVNGRPFSVVGVAPPGFRGTQRGDAVDLWLLPEASAVVTPAGRRISLVDREAGWLLWMIARLAADATVADAQAELDALVLRLVDRGPPEHRPARLAVYPGIGLRPWQHGLLEDPLVLLSFAVALLMLGVCANLGGLLLARAASRADEFGLRIALGGTKPQIVRQLLIEGLALAALGGALGLLLAKAATAALKGAMLGPYLPRLAEIPLDGRVLLFTLGLSIGSGMVFGLVPAWWISRRPHQPSLYRTASGPMRSRLLESLTMGQVTLSLVLLVFTGLFVRSLLNMQAVPIGFAPDQVLNARFELDPRQSASGAAAGLLERLAVVPQVRRASLAAMVPLGSTRGPGGYALFGLPASEVKAGVLRNSVSPGYFATLGIVLLAGRDFLPTDPAPVVIDEALAKRFFPRGDALGSQADLSGKLREIVGVAADVRMLDLSSAHQPVVYIPFSQYPETSFTVQVRVAGEPEAALEAVKGVAADLGPSLPLVAVSLYRDEVSQSLAQPRIMSQLCGAISAIALIVTALGLYGTLAYTVSRRTREIGIRMALGASFSKIVALVVGRGLLLTVSGMVAGVFVAVWTTSPLSEFLFEVEPDDPAVFLAVVALLTAIGLLASWLPARAAARVDPLSVIRHE